MNLAIDKNQLLKTYEAMKQEIQYSSSTRYISTLEEAQEHIILREAQLKSVIEISEKILKRFDSWLNSKDLISRGDLSTIDLKIKLQDLQTQFVSAEESLKASRSEVKTLKLEIDKLEKNQGSNNLFTVELYQSEIEDLKRDYDEKISILEGIFLDR